MQKAYKYRIYPTKAQQKVLARFFGCVRFVFNHFLTLRKQEYASKHKTLSYGQCSEELTRLKWEPDYEWLSECDSTALQSTLRYLDNAYQKFFKGEGGYPKYKSRKHHRDSYTTKCNYGKNDSASIELTARAIKLPKLGWIKTRVSRPIDGRILNATVSRTPGGKYYVSVICERPDYQYTFDDNTEIGVDVGVKEYCVTSEGMHYPNPKPLLRAEKRLAIAQQELSRKTSGSRRYERQRIKVARLHEHVANIRRDYQQKLSTELIRHASLIGVESLDIKELLQNGRAELSERIQDCGWSEFLRQLSYKAEWYRRTLVKVDRYFPSSQLCSTCGHKNQEVKDLQIRRWKCPVCGTVHDRDENAAANILKEAKRLAALPA